MLQLHVSGWDDYAVWPWFKFIPVSLDEQFALNFFCLRESFSVLDFGDMILNLLQKFLLPSLLSVSLPWTFLLFFCRLLLDNWLSATGVKSSYEWCLLLTFVNKHLDETILSRFKQALSVKAFLYSAVTRWQCYRNVQCPVFIHFPGRRFVSSKNVLFVFQIHEFYE